MIINRVLDHIFINTSNLAVLRVLNDRIIGLSGRETARLAGISLRAAQLSLNSLEKLKIVNRHYGGREHSFTLNRNNYIAKEIISNIFSTEESFRTIIISHIIKKLAKLTDSVILFGSVARQEESTDSDMDICIVYSKKIKEIEKAVSILRDMLNDKFGVTLAPFYITRKEFKTRVRKSKSPVDSIIKEGKVISGLSIKSMING
ncbi:MAG TPA: nucleotidyltransferase domain-containing protein [Ignavibacteriaceae bacterium]|nr:nucleotidyltransferase domain-containing protein [Ignavibacteriaceae bacterium]